MSRKPFYPFEITVEIINTFVEKRRFKLFEVAEKYLQEVEEKYSGSNCVTISTNKAFDDEKSDRASDEWSLQDLYTRNRCLMFMVKVLDILQRHQPENNVFSSAKVESDDTYCQLRMFMGEKEGSLLVLVNFLAESVMVYSERRNKAYLSRKDWATFHEVTPIQLCKSIETVFEHLELRLDE